MATGSIQSLTQTLNSGGRSMSISSGQALAAASVKWVYEDLFHWVVMPMKEVNPPREWK